jgi:methylglyoxal synthase
MVKSQRNVLLHADPRGALAFTADTRTMHSTMDATKQRHGSMAPRVVLIAHDTCKFDLTAWATYNRGTLSRCQLFATGTTGQRVFEATDLGIERLLSGPAGGDAQVGAMLAEGRLDYVIFFWDPLTTQPHDVDVKALLRLAVLYNVPTACNRATADYLISSPLFFHAETRRRHPSGPDLASAS